MQASTERNTESLRERVMGSLSGNISPSNDRACSESSKTWFVISLCEAFLGAEESGHHFRFIFLGVLLRSTGL